MHRKICGLVNGFCGQGRSVNKSQRQWCQMWSQKGINLWLFLDQISVNFGSTETQLKKKRICPIWGQLNPHFTQTWHPWTEVIGHRVSLPPLVSGELAWSCHIIGQRNNGHSESQWPTTSQLYCIPVVRLYCILVVTVSSLRLCGQCGVVVSSIQWSALTCGQSHLSLARSRV